MKKKIVPKKEYGHTCKIKNTYRAELGFNNEPKYPWTFESFVSGAFVGALLVYIIM